MDQNLNPNQNQSPLSFVFEIAQTVLVALTLTAVIYLFIATPHQVEGKSMEVNFEDGNLILSNKIIQLIGDKTLGERMDYDYERGDVIIFQQFGKEDYIKRIVAVEHDRVKIENGSVYVNGKKIDEHYIPNETSYRTELPGPEYAFMSEGQEKVVPSGKYFVLGDNRRHSMDSRYSSVGFIDRSEIKGKVFIRYWPPNRIGIIPRGSFDEINN